MSSNNKNNRNNNSCIVCLKPSGNDETCSMRCFWKTAKKCVQCGKALATTAAEQLGSPFCSWQCGDEARRGNYCPCGIRQLPQGSTRCTPSCTAVPGLWKNTQVESPFPSRKTTPEEGQGGIRKSDLSHFGVPTAAGSGSVVSSSASSVVDGTQQDTLTAVGGGGNIINNGSKSLRSCTTIEPSGHTAKLWTRIATPFFQSGLSVMKIIQINNAPAEKKVYNANRLAVNDRLVANKQPKIGGGGEGNEQKRFVPLLAGCGRHLFDGSYENQQPQVCSDSSCDVCRVVGEGMRLNTMTGRTSHFSVPNLESVIPWSLDSNSVIPGSTENQTFSAVALVRAVLGNVNLVDDLSQVAPPPIGFDSVVLRDAEAIQKGTDSCFSFNDYSISPEYVVLFSKPSQEELQQQQQQQQSMMQNQQQQQQQQQQQYHHHQQNQYGNQTPGNYM